MKFIGSKSVLSQSVCQAEVDKRNLHTRRQQRPQRMKIPQGTSGTNSGFATSPQSSPPKSTWHPSLLDRTESETLHDDINAEVDPEMVSTAAVAVADDCATSQAMNKERGIQDVSVLVETSSSVGASHDAIDSSVSQLPAAQCAPFVSDHDSGSAATRLAEDHLDTSEDVIWAGKPADKVGNADVCNASAEGGSSSSSNELCHNRSRVASKLEFGNGDAFGPAWISAPVLQNEVGSLVMPNNWRYMPPPRPPVPDVTPSIKATGQVRRLLTESAENCEVEVTCISKRRLVAEVLDQLIARSHRVDDQLGAELRSGRAMRLTLEVLQRQNVCLQMQLL